MTARLLLLALTVGWAVLWPGGVSAEKDRIWRVSVDSAGNEGNGGSADAAISGDGRYVVFGSGASNLDPSRTHGGGIFVHDRQTGKTGQLTDSGRLPSVAADGRFVAFSDRRVYVFDSENHRTEAVSVDSEGNEGNGDSFRDAITADGRCVAFQSSASNLVPGDTNGNGDVFVHDSQTGETTGVSVDSAGNQGNGDSRSPAISANGRYVAFQSNASNLVPGDTNGSWDSFVHDLTTRATIRVSVDSKGKQSSGDPYWGGASNIAISSDGRYVAFASSAPDLVEEDRNGVYDVFVHDRDTGKTTRVSVGSRGAEANDGSWGVAISGDGQRVAFASQASNLVEGDTDKLCKGRDGAEYKCADIFVHDLESGKTVWASVGSDGSQGNGASTYPAISADGCHVAFTSEASNLVPNDTNGNSDIFVYDLCPEDGDGIESTNDTAAGGTGNDSSSPDANGTLLAFIAGAMMLLAGSTVWYVRRRRRSGDASRSEQG